MSPIHSQVKSEGEAVDPSLFNFGFASNTLSQVDLQDATAALKVWFDYVSALHETGTKAEVTACKNQAVLESLVNDKKLDAVGMEALDFLATRHRLPLRPSLVGLSDGVVTREYILLVPGSTDVNQISDLEGLDLLVLTGGLGDLPMLWLDVVLMRLGLPAKEVFFKSSKSVLSPSQAVLPVFFGQAGGCIVTRQSFSAMVEMNPQLGKDLRIVMTSPGYLWAVVCFREDYDENKSGKIRDAALEMHNDPGGKQALMLFRLDRMVKMVPAYLEGLEALVEEYEVLSEKTEKEIGYGLGR
jgi:ABC-type phosphate/phosphonate transport system substrate-binding protein